jgi:hypothetical protein
MALSYEQGRSSLSRTVRHRGADHCTSLRINRAERRIRRIYLRPSAKQDTAFDLCFLFPSECFQPYEEK